MNTLSTLDRSTVRDLNAVASGIGRSSRNVHSSTTSDIPPAWIGKNPHPIPIPANGASSHMKRKSNPASNPYGGRRMASTLTQGSRMNGHDNSGNHTAMRTVLSSAPAGGKYGGSKAIEPPAKRLKMSPVLTSPHFDNLNGARKAKAPAGNLVVISDDEDVGTRLPQAHTTTGPHAVHDEKDSTPDPIDCLSAPASRAASPLSGKHAFERDSPKPKDPLPPDGQSTARLRARLGESSAPEVVDVDASSEIESASGFDLEDAQARKVPTPNGRTVIPGGNVKQKITMYEQKDTRAPPKQPERVPLPMIDFKKAAKGSVKTAMKPKTGKSITSLSQFDLKRVPEPLDATAPSGSKAVEKTKAPPVLPLEALSLGCHMMENTDTVQPQLWARIQRLPARNAYLLHLIDGHFTKQPMATFHLDRDFDSFQYTAPKFAMEKDAAVVLQFQSTPSAKLSRKVPSFQPGSALATGWITLKLLISHANCNGSAYPDFLGVLKNQIQKHEEIRGGSAAKACWEQVLNAARHKPDAVERVARPTRTATTPRKPSPISAGPSTSSSTAIVSSNREGKPASSPPARTYGRVTRQSARDARVSETPEVLDELVLVYPPSGTGAVNITRGDLKRLDNGQYLNDTLIEFGLKYWLHTLGEHQPELAEQVHVFNSFFFKKLNSKKDVKETYLSVRKWTSKVDIFKKKYIIVPINENFHWYLAIIVNPVNMLHPPPPQALRPVPQTRKRKREEPPPASTATETEATADDGVAENRSDTAPSDTPPDVMTIDRESEGEGQEVETMLRFSQSCNIVDPDGEPAAAKGPSARSRSATGDRVDIADVDLQYPSSQEPMDVDIVPGREKESRPPDPAGESSRGESPSVDDPSSAEGASVVAEQSGQTGAEEDRPADEEQTQKASDDYSQYPIAYVYTFDSLGSRHPGPANKLAKYLQYEAADKKGYQIEDTCMATYKQAKAPMQKNFCDCGLFVLAFAEAFMKDPIHSVQSIQNHQINWYSGSMENLRETFRTITIELSERWRKERSEKEGPKEDEPSEKAKAKPVEVAVIEDSDDDIIVGDIIPAPSKGAGKGGKKSNTGKAARLRG